MESASALARRLFNQFTQGVGNAVQSAQKTIPQAVSNVGNFITSQPFSYIPLAPQTPKSYTIGKAASDLADFTYRPITRVGGALSLTQNNIPSFNPSSPLDKFIYGNSPVLSYPQQQKTGSQFLQGLGVNQNVANPLATAGVLGLTALDLAPVNPLKLGEKAALKGSLSSEGKIIKGKLSVSDIPTLTEIENRVQVGMGKPDLYTQRGKKIAEMEGKPFVQKPVEMNTKWLDTHGSTLDKTAATRARVDPTGVTEPLQKIVNTDFNNVKNKVNILDYLRTPDRVFKKIGLGDEAALLRKQYDTYTVELPKELDKITAWSKRAPEENQAIFQFLDGNKGVTLSPEAKQVATEIRTYLKGWATKLQLPKDQQISDYITHIFPKGMVQKEFDPEIAKLIRGKVVGSVYDPFLQKRMGKPEYLQDTWQALSAYSKRATRKFYMDQALEKVSAKADALPEESYNYVKQNISHINMQPTQLDNLVDNAIKSTPIGYKLGQRPVANLTQKSRQAVFRGLLGLNPSSALRNLQQSTNTYATLGEKYFLQGAIKTVQNLPRFLSGVDTELHNVGVLGKDIAGIDQTINPTKKFWENTDKGLFYMFNQAENINRGIAYFGAKAQALNKGLSEAQAIDYAKQVVRKTQFNYDVIDLPVALQSDIAKTVFQFAKYPLAQTEFLAEMLKRKDIAGSVRFIAANLLFIGTIGHILGLKPQDMLPQFRFGTPPTLQAPAGFAAGLVGAPDQYGNVPKGNPLQRAFSNPDFKKGITNYIPAGGQIKRTLEATKAINEGGSYTPSGDLRFPVTHNAQALAFGIWSTPEGQAYLKNKQNTNLSQPEIDANKFEADIKGNDAKATKVVNQMYQQFSKATPEGKKLLLQQWRQQGVLNESVLRTFLSRGKAERQQSAGDYAKAFAGLSSNDHRAAYLIKLLKEKSPSEKKIILDQLRAAGLLTTGLAQSLQRLRSATPTQTP